MPGIAHIGVGFAAKKAAPTVPVIFLIIAAELIEIIFMILWGFGVEHMPDDPGLPLLFDYSHTYGLGLWKSKVAAWIGEIGILMAGIFIFIITRRKNQAGKLRIKP